MSSAEETHEKVDTCNNYSMLSVEDEGSSPGAMAKPEEEKYAFFEDTARASSALGLTAPSSPDKPYDYLPVIFHQLGSVCCEISAWLVSPCTVHQTDKRAAKLGREGNPLLWQSYIKFN